MYQPDMQQLHGLSIQRAELYGKPNLGCSYKGNSRYMLHGDMCVICRKRMATNAHHIAPRSSGLFVMDTEWGHFVLKSPLFALCGSGSTGCHNDFHGGARYEVEWQWDSDTWAQRWWSGWMLAHGYLPHSERLFNCGQYVISDKKLGTETVYR